MGVKKGNIPWNRGLTRETDERVARATTHSSDCQCAICCAKRGKVLELHKPNCKCPICRRSRGEYVKPWNKGLFGKDNPHYGRKRSEETKQKIREKAKGRKHSEETKLKCASFGMLGKTQSEYQKRTVGKINSKKMKKLWRDPEYRKRQVEVIIKGSIKTPNKAEQRLDSILQSLLPGEYKYVGDGEFILGGKCPDFININGKKKIIELFGEFWHEKDKKDNGQNRVDFFKKYGYDTLIIWEGELQNEPALKNKIIEFHNGD